MKTAFHFALISFFTIFLLSTTFAQLGVKDVDDNILLQVNDYGDAGTLFLPPFGPILPGFPINNQMLYNIEGTLYWNGSALGTSGSAAGWTFSNSTISTGRRVELIGGSQGGRITVSNPFTQGKAVIGEATLTGNTENYGGYFSAAGDAGSGVYGKGTGGSGIGVYGEATGSSGKGVQGLANGTSAFAGYFTGRGYFSENVGIGESSPIYKLHVKDDQSNNFVARIENTSIGTDADGLAILLNVGTPASSNHFIRFQKSGGVNIGNITGNGNSVNYNTTSDARLKTNIEDYNNALNTVKKIGIKKYERIANPGIEEIGVIAQELQKVYPQAVSGSPNSDVKTDPMMVDYSKLTPLLVKAVQEQQEKIKELEKQNAEIRSQNTVVNSKNEELENRLSKIESLLEGKRFTSVRK